MLSYALAIAVGLSSLILFSTAFLMSDIHRQDDFFWSGVGLFYALVLWFCATRITGGLLLGQTAAVALLISYNWQTLKLRKAIANPDRAEELNKFSVLAAINSLFTRGKSKPQPTNKSVQPTVVNETVTIPETPSTDVQPESIVATEETPEVKPETPETQEVVTESSTTTDKIAKKPGLFGKFFGGKKQKSSSDTSQPDTSSITNTKLDDLLDEEASTEAQPTQVSSTKAFPVVESTPEVTPTTPTTEAESSSDTVTETTPEVTPKTPTTEAESPSDTVTETTPEVTPTTPTTEAESSSDTVTETTPEVTPTTPTTEAESSSDTVAETVTAEKAIASEPESTETSETITIQPPETVDNQAIKMTETSESQESTKNSDEKPQNS